MYSQNLEEQFILQYFGNFVGTFLDIGANDGKTLSNTYALAQRGWKGYCIEPSPSAYKRLAELYKGSRKVKTYPFAIGDHNDTVPLYESGPLLNHEDTGLVSTFNASEMERFRNKVTYTPVDVKVFKWRTFVNRLRNRQFDFISIDVEGNDAMVASQIDFSQTRCVCIEWNSNDILRQTFKQLFGENNFKIIYTSAENLLFAR